MYLSWIIPAYNEERRIEKSLREVDAYLRSRRENRLISAYEIVVVVSASRDRTAEIATRLAAELPSLRLLMVENRGKGWAVQEGMIRAEGDIRLFSDTDNSTPPESFDAMVPFFRQGYDIVISSRSPKDAPGASRGVEGPWYRKVLGNLGNLLIQIVGVWGIRDTQNGFKALTARSARAIFSQSRIPGFAFDIEMLALARSFGFRIAVIPIRWKFDPDSTVTLKAYLQVFADVFRIRWNLITGRYRFR